MKAINIAIFAIVQLFFCQFLIAQNNLNEEWLNKDVKIFTDFLSILESNEFDLTTLRQINGIRISGGYGNLGLGYNKTAYYQSGGYTAITIKMLLNPDNLIIKYKITINSNANAFNVLNEMLDLNRLLSHYKKSVRGNYIYFESEKTNDELFSRMMICFNEYFGINGGITIPATLSDDYFLLTDPFNNDTYGFIVGYGAIVPRFRQAIERIKEENNNDILMLIMASPNPTGRIYAIEAISDGNINNIINNRIYSYILNRIFELRIPIEVGAGCIVSNITIDSYRRINEAMRYIRF